MSLRERLLETFSKLVKWLYISYIFVILAVMTTPVYKSTKTDPCTKKEEQKPVKKFSPQEDEPPLLITPLHVFQTMMNEEIVVPCESGVQAIDDLFLKLCDRVEYVVSNGVEETTIVLDENQGEITLTKYDTAPMQIKLTFSLSTQTAKHITPHLPALSGRLSERFQEIDFSLQTQLLSLRKEEKKYATQKLKKN